jgi:hypothetical protein
VTNAAHSRRGDDVTVIRRALRGAHSMTRRITATERPTASELLRTPGALLSRSDLRALGLERRAVDVVFRECPVIQLPGYSRPLIRAEAYLAFLEGRTYCDRCGDRVRPT